jgi:hypothetical protein
LIGRGVGYSRGAAAGASGEGERRRIMRPYLPLALIVAGCVAACSWVKKDPNQAQLAHGCQIVKCECHKVRSSMLPSFTTEKPADVLWHEDGTAYCPEGMQLETKEKPSIYDRPLN